MTKLPPISPGHTPESWYRRLLEMSKTAGEPKTQNDLIRHAVRIANAYGLTQEPPHEAGSHRMKPSDRCAKAFWKTFIGAAPAVDEKGLAIFIAEQSGCDELLVALRNMVREWIEIVGDESENSTPSDTLEKARAAIAKATREEDPCPPSP